jgi:hypothetical protein
MKKVFISCICHLRNALASRRAESMAECSFAGPALLENT